MNKNLICIVGRTASGKDTIVRRLMDKHGLKSVVSHTTRPIRPSEKDGREHHFITENIADEILKNKDDIAAYTEIKGNKYFTTIDAINNAHIYVIDPNGIKYLREKYPNMNLIVVYVKCNKSINETHAIKRGDSESTFNERYESENEQFSEFEKSNDWYTLIENNSTLDDLFKKVDKLADLYKNNTNEFLNKYLIDQYPDSYKNIMMFEHPNYKSAAIGVSEDHNFNRVIYSYSKMINHLMKYDNMDYDEAVEFIDYNTIRALNYYPNSPIIMYDIT